MFPKWARDHWQDLARQAYHRQQLAMEEEEEKAEEELAKLTQFQGEDGAQHLGVSGWLPGSSAQTLSSSRYEPSHDTVSPNRFASSCTHFRTASAFERNCS